MRRNASQKDFWAFALISSWCFFISETKDQTESESDWNIRLYLCVCVIKLNKWSLQFSQIRQINESRSKGLDCWINRGDISFIWSLLSALKLHYWCHFHFLSADSPPLFPFHIRNLSRLLLMNSHIHSAWSHIPYCSCLKGTNHFADVFLQAYTHFCSFSCVLSLSATETASHYWM